MNNPTVEASLHFDSQSGAWAWKVAACPFCGKKHLHGGGVYPADPLTYLGGRVAHCHGGQDYVLIAGDTKALDRVQRMIKQGTFPTPNFRRFHPGVEYA